jgi:hypothetical protein
MSAAFPMPKANRAYSSPVTNGDALPARIPPTRKSVVPVIVQVQTIANRKKTIEVDRRMPR